jgi:glycosyltransferase involved in cell wall biosynthesis
VATRIFTPEAAAAAFRLDALSRALRGAGARVRVLTSRPPDLDTSRDPEGVSIRRARTLRDRSGYLKGYLQYLSFDAPLAARLLATRPRPDVIVAEPPPTTGAVVRVTSSLLGVPYVYYAADVWSDASESMGAPRAVVRALRAVERFALSGATRVIAVNQGVADRVRELGARDIEVVLNGIDISLFNPAGPPSSGEAELGDLRDAPYLVYAGTASQWQGAGIFLDAFARVREEFPDLHLVYLGQGSDMEAIARRAEGDPRVHVLGRRPPEEAAVWQARARAALVSIVPGRGYDFAYPTKVLAALSCGTPVVYAGTGPVAEDVAGAGLGAVAASFDAGAVADAVRDVLARPREGARLRSWVAAHRSLAVTGRDAAEVVLAVARRSRS